MKAIYSYLSTMDYDLNRIKENADFAFSNYGENVGDIDRKLMLENASVLLTNTKYLIEYLTNKN